MTAPLVLRKMHLVPPLQVNWLDQRNWNCNNNTHPSRHGTYAGMSMHPMEVRQSQTLFSLGWVAVTGCV